MSHDASIDSNHVTYKPEINFGELPRPELQDSAHYTDFIATYTCYNMI